MALIKVYDDTVGRATCKSCAAPITWAENAATGKRIPFDGELVYVRTSTDGGRVLGEVDTAVSLSHFATCPQAADWRRR